MTIALNFDLIIYTKPILLKNIYSLVEYHQE